MTPSAYRESMGHESMGHESMGHESMGHESMGHESMGHESVGHESVAHESVPCKPRDPEELKKIKSKLKQDNELKQEMIYMVSADIAKVEYSILNTGKDIELYETSEEEYLDKIQKLKTENDSLIARISQIKQNIKSLKSDEESTLLLMETLLEEYQGLMNDKTDLIKRIMTLHDVIENLNCERKEKVPKLKKYDTLLKNAFYELQETENSMDLSLKLWQRKSNYRPVNS